MIAYTHKSFTVTLVEYKDSITIDADVIRNGLEAWFLANGGFNTKITHVDKDDYPELNFDVPEWKKSFSFWEGKGVFPVAHHCRECTQTREYCYFHGFTYPRCTNEPNKEEQLRLYP
jgi:hypothetical protein